MTKYINISLDRDDFSQRIGDGIPKGSLFIVEGEDGGGKSIISQRITYGALINNHSVTYISTEMSTLDFIKQMRSLNYNIEKYLLEKKLLYIPLFTFFGRIKEGKNLIFELKKGKYKKIFDSDIVIIDSLSYPLLDGITREDMIDFVMFLSKIKYQDKVIILTYDPRELDSTAVSFLRRISDIYFKTYISSLAGQQVRVIEIVRFRNPKGEYQLVIPYRVEAGLGLVVEIVSLV